jgi:hypothetical protein
LDLLGPKLIEKLDGSNVTSGVFTAVVMPAETYGIDET